MSKTKYWAIGWRFLISFTATIAIIILAANQIAGIGFRYGKAAGYSEAAYACQQGSVRATNEGTKWRTNVYW